MADTTEIKDIVESCVHDALRNVIQNFSDKYGICVHDVKITWQDHSSITQLRRIVESVTIHSETR